MKKSHLLFTALFACVAAHAAEVVGSVEAQVVTAACVSKKESVLSFLSGAPKYNCKLWIESEYGQQHIQLKLTHPVKRGDRLTLIQTSDNEYTVQ